MASTTIREVTSEATIQEKRKLRREFKLFDMVFITTTAIIGLDTLGSFSAKGTQALTWVVISAITFLIPYALLTSELGTTFTQEGGMYEWCKLACGRFYAAIGAMLYWVSNPLWIGGSLSVGAIAAIKVFWFGDANYLFFGTQLGDAIVEILIALAFIWITTYSAIASLRSGKWLAVIGAYLKFILLGIFVVLGLVFILGGHTKSSSFSVAGLIPSDWGLILSSILPVVIFQWVGFEVQSGASEEMTNPQRDVPRSIFSAGFTATVAYIVFLLVILFALSSDKLSNVGSFFSAFQAVSAVLPADVARVLGWLIAAGFIIAISSSGSSWLIGADRAYAIAALDRTAPARLGRFSGRFGTPIAVNIMSGTVATITMIVAVIITEEFSQGSIAALFAIVLNFTISTTLLSYLFIFPAYLILRYKYSQVQRRYRVPGGMIGAWIVTLLPFAYAAVASYYTLFPLDATIQSYKVDRLTYDLTQFGTLAVIVLLAVVFYIWGHLEARNRDVVVEVPTGNELLEFDGLNVGAGE